MPDRPNDQQVHDALRLLAADFKASQETGPNRKTCYQVVDGVQVTAGFAIAERGRTDVH